MARQPAPPIPDTGHDAMALLVDTSGTVRLYRATCKCGWTGTVAVRDTAVAAADWHNDREGTDHGGPR